LGGATRWDGATRQACAPLSFFDVAEAGAGAKRPHVASADNPAKWLRAIFRQIYFRKASARVDRRAWLNMRSACSQEAGIPITLMRSRRDGRRESAKLDSHGDFRRDSDSHALRRHGHGIPTAWINSDREFRSFPLRRIQTDAVTAWISSYGCVARLSDKQRT
jgi:hypothetical protein